VKHSITTRSSFVLAVTLALFSDSTFAAFFQLAENSPAGLGNAFAGGAAIAEDASTVWYNPAGLTRLKGNQLVAAGHLIFPSTEFDNESSTITSLLGILPPANVLTGGDGGDAGEDALVPNVYYAQSIDDDLTVGIGLNTPFGLATDYDDGWVGRYHALFSEIKTINVNPGLGYKLSERVSIGGGINIQFVEAIRVAQHAARSVLPLKRVTVRPRLRRIHKALGITLVFCSMSAIVPALALPTVRPFAMSSRGTRILRPSDQARRRLRRAPALSIPILKPTSRFLPRRR